MIFEGFYFYSVIQVTVKNKDVLPIKCAEPDRMREREMEKS